MIDKIEISYDIPEGLRNSETERACEHVFDRVHAGIRLELLMMPKAAVVVLRKAGVEERL